MRRLLVAIDGSPPSERALSFAIETFPDAELVLLHVIDPAKGVGVGVGGPGASEAWYESAKTEAEELLATAADRAAAAGMTAETVVDTGRPAATIVEYAEEREVDHVVMGSHGRAGVSRLLLGSVAEAVVRRSPAPVTVVRTPEDVSDEDGEGGTDATEVPAAERRQSADTAAQDGRTDESA